MMLKFAIMMFVYLAYASSQGESKREDSRHTESMLYDAMEMRETAMEMKETAVSEYAGVPCKATVVDNKGGKHNNIEPFKIGNVWVFGAQFGNWYKLTAVNEKGEKQENRYTETKMTESNKANTWKDATKGGDYTVENMKFCGGSHVVGNDHSGCDMFESNKLLNTLPRS